VGVFKKKSMKRENSSLGGLANTWLHVGEKTTSTKKLEEAEKVLRGWKRLAEWLAESTVQYTRLAALFRLLILVSWTAVLNGPQIERMLASKVGH
jgi:hypothetical protein